MRSHVSGKPWRDLDIHLGEKEARDADAIIARMVAFLRFVLGLRAHEVSSDMTISPLYGTFSAKFTVLRDEQPVEVYVDVSTGELKSMFLPVTIGSCLYMKKGAIGFRKAIDIEISSNWRVYEIVELLRNATDVILVMKEGRMTASKRYKRFFWTRIDAMKTHEWNLRPSLRGLPLRVLE